MDQRQNINNFKETIRQTINLINQDFELHAAALVRNTLESWEDVLLLFREITPFVPDAALNRMRDTLTILYGVD